MEEYKEEEKNKEMVEILKMEKKEDESGIFA